MIGAGDAASIPLTVIGGYLGAGKTTLLNHLLAAAEGRRLAVIVNDFGELGIDAERLDAAGVVNLPNGCVCCTLGDDLHGTLRNLAAADEPPDQIVVEASGVADPRVVAAWGTVPPFAPGGVIVLAAADDVRVRAGDRYVGGEVVRQLEAADLVVVTKGDLVDDVALADVEAWCGRVSGGAPTTRSAFGRVPIEIALGVRPDAPATALPGTSAGHADRYSRWAWRHDGRIDRTSLDDFLTRLPTDVLRLKGTAALTDGSTVAVDVVGRRQETRPVASGPDGVRLEAIALGDTIDLAPPAAPGV